MSGRSKSMSKIEQSNPNAKTTPTLTLRDKSRDSSISNKAGVVANNGNNRILRNHS